MSRNSTSGWNPDPHERTGDRHVTGRYHVRTNPEPSMTVNRRDFISAAGALAASASLASSLEPTPDPQSNSAAEWYNRPMRWMQLVLVENDPGQYDPSFWLDYFSRVHADAACLSAGGCVAYYPTKIEYHHRSQWMKDTDPFGQLVAGCRKKGMVVVARTDPHSVRDDAAKAHPEW